MEKYLEIAIDLWQELMKFIKSLTNGAYAIAKVQVSQSWFQDGVAIGLAQLKNLLGVKQLLKLWGLLFFAISVAMMWLPGFLPPLPFEADSTKWLRWVILGLYSSWTIWFTSFLQRDDKYENLSWGNSQGIDADGNKGLAMFGIGIFAWCIATIGQYWFTGSASWWFMIVTAFMQLVPLFMGDLLQEQARRLGPLFTNVALVATTFIYIVFG